jgi:hypothetical protein
MAIVLLPMTLGMALIHNGEDRKRGYEVLRTLRETCIEERFALNVISFVDAYIARELVEHGQEGLAIEQWRGLADEMVDAGNYANIDIPLMFLAETLISHGKYAEADLEIERLVATTANREWKSREISVLRLRVLLARARDDAGYPELRDQYRAMANDLGFEGHMQWAAEMP